jgi:UDP-N-acetylglucosamine 2-epimerase (non-hydrolysing)
MPLKVVTVVGTRPEIIKLSRVIAALDRCTDHVLVHTGQNYDYELNEIFFQQLELGRPRHFLEAAGRNAAETIGHVIARSDVIFEQEQPDALLLLGDTNSCLAAISAKRRRIPIFHMEAGNRCFDQRVPEEINRKIVDHISDINLPYTEHARRYLLAEGLPAEMVIKTGSPMREVLEHYASGIAGSAVLGELGLSPREYFVISAHREENIDSEVNFRNFLETLNAVAAKYQQPLIVSTHPRTRKRLEATLGTTAPDPLIRFLKPLGFLDYVQLQQQARCVISDSGTLTEESSICNFPGVMIRQAHERPEGMDEGTVIMAGLTPTRVLDAVHLAMDQAAGAERPFRLVEDYETRNVSQKVVRIIFSYVDYVNRVVWHAE